MTDWAYINNAIIKMRQSLILAENNLDLQNIGLIGRNILIMLGRNVYIKEKHGKVDEKDIGKDDSKRMLEAFINYELSGVQNESKRGLIKKTVDVSHELTHKIENATRLDAELCIYSVSNLVRMIYSIYKSRKED